MQTYTYNATGVNVDSGNAIVFTTNKNTCPCITHTENTSTITIKRKGLYLVRFNATGYNQGATSGNITVGLYNGDNAITDAISSATSGSTTDVVNLNFTSTLRVLPSCNVINNNAVLSIKNTGISATYTLCSIVITRIGD